jgi:hypothetical protein
MSAAIEFRRHLTDPLNRRRLSVGRWSSGGRYSQNLLELSTSPKPTVLYVKEFNVPRRPGFWGLTQNHIKGLEKAGTRWFAVLLLMNVASGYVLTGGQVRHRIDDGTFKLSNDGDFKVNEGPDLKPAQRFQSLDELLDRIL